jgi:hypothetical protein
MNNISRAPIKNLIDRFSLNSETENMEEMSGSQSIIRETEKVPIFLRAENINILGRTPTKRLNRINL